MTYKIAVITTTFLHDFMENILNELNFDCSFMLIEYKNFKNISEVYSSLEDQVDGYLVSGSVAKHVIEKTVIQHKKPIMWFGTDLLSLYRNFIDLMLDNRDIDVDRIMMDFLIPIRKNPKFIEILDKKNLKTVTNDMEKWLYHSKIEDLYSLETDISEEIIKMYHEKKLDYVICTYSSIVSILKEKNIACIYANPAEDHIKETVSRLLSLIEINKMRENLPAVISVSKRNNRNIDDSDLDTVSLQKCLLDYNKENFTDFLVQKSNDGFDIYSSLSVLNQMTNFGENCQLSQYLSETLDFKVCIGYGVGNNIVEAKNNATAAKQEAFIKGESFIMDEKLDLIGPLNTEFAIRIKNDITPEMYKMAEESKLSTMTIQKLMSILEMMGSTQITTNYLAAKLNVTVRNANRILGKLEQSGYANVLYNQSHSSKGRPIKIYQVILPKDKV